MGYIFFGGIQHSPVNGRSVVSCNFGVLTGEDVHMYFYSTILNVPASVRSITFLSFIVPIFAQCLKCSLDISNFPEVISSLSYSIVFLYFFALITALRKAFLSLLAILWNSAFKWVYLSFSPLPLAFLFSAIFRHPQTTILPFYISFSWGWF